jgi:hypothetical protein
MQASMLRYDLAYQPLSPCLALLTTDKQTQHTRPASQLASFCHGQRGLGRCGGQWSDSEVDGLRAGEEGRGRKRGRGGEYRSSKRRSQRGDRLKRRARVVAGAGTYAPVCVERRSRRREGGDEEGREGGQGGWGIRTRFMNQLAIPSLSIQLTPHTHAHTHTYSTK